LPKYFISFGLFVVLALLLYQVGMRYVLTYRLTDEDVRAVLFGVVTLSVRRYRFITEVHTDSFFDMRFYPAWIVANKFASRGVVIFRKGSLFWGAVRYTPKDLEAFARELRRRVYKQTGRLPLGS